MNSYVEAMKALKKRIEILEECQQEHQRAKRGEGG